MAQGIARTDEEKQALIAEFDAAVAAGRSRKDWFKEKEMDRSFFYRMRAQLKGQPEKKRSAPAAKKSRLSPEGVAKIREAQRARWAAAKANGTGKHTKTAPTQFQALSKDDRLQMIAKYDKLPRHERAAFRALYGMQNDTGILSYYRQQLKTDTSALVANGHPPTHQLLPHDLPVPTSMVTLEDACNAMQIRIDIYTEFLDHLKRMLSGR